MKKPKPLQIRLAIYRRFVIVFFGHSFDEIIAFGKQHGIERHLTDGWKRTVEKAIQDRAYRGVTVEYGDGNTDILIWLPKKPETVEEYGHLAHELSHVVDKIAFQTDPDCCWDSESGMSEPRAYLFGFLFEQVFRALKH